MTVLISVSLYSLKPQSSTRQLVRENFLPSSKVFIDTEGEFSKVLNDIDKNGFPSFIETENYSLVNRAKDFAKNELHTPQRMFI